MIPTNRPKPFQKPEKTGRSHFPKVSSHKSIPPYRAALSPNLGSPLHTAKLTTNETYSSAATNRPSAKGLGRSGRRKLYTAPSTIPHRPAAPIRQAASAGGIIQRGGASRFCVLSAPRRSGR